MTGYSGSPISASLTHNEVESIPELEELKGYLMVCRPETRELMGTVSITSAVEGSGSAAAKRRIVRGIERAYEIARAGTRLSHCIWDEHSCAEDPTRTGVRLFHFPSVTHGDGPTESEAAPWVLVIPGGGYQSVCNAFEGFPAAAELNEAGYDAFVLSYRVRLDHLMPRPFDDVAQAIRYVRMNAHDLGVGESAPYAVMGFSAGGHLAAEWGTANHGYLAYGMSKPAALVLAYAPIDVRLSASSSGERDAFIRSLIGDGDLSELDEYAVNLQMDERYPDTFLWQCQDDDVVPFANYELMMGCLEELGIPHEGVSYALGGHALMMRHEEEADHWIRRALPFLDKRLGS